MNITQLEEVEDVEVVLLLATWKNERVELRTKQHGLLDLYCKENSGDVIVLKDKDGNTVAGGFFNIYKELASTKIDWYRVNRDK